MSKMKDYTLDHPGEVITADAKPRENPYAIKPIRMTEAREALGTPITQGRTEDFMKSYNNNPHN